jgi:hypothetical protein
MKDNSENWINAFHDYANMKNWSINTIKVYANAIKQFKASFPSLRLKEISDDKNIKAWIFENGWIGIRLTAVLNIASLKVKPN